MGLGMLCARRAAIIAALAGGFVIAVVAARMCAEGLTWGGGAVMQAFKSGLHSLGL